MQVGEAIAKASTTNVHRIEMDLEITILMIEEQKNVVPIIIVLKQKNANEDVEPRAHIDGGDILNFIYYYHLLPHPSSQVKRMGGVFFLSIFLL
jgi:predicted type IV restriction endonuclease